MLNPFQIKGLHGSPPLQEASEPAAPSEHIGFGDDHLIVEDRLGPQNRAALVQLSTSEYDDIATNHPRARLTYLDEDDGDLITVSSLAVESLLPRLTVDLGWIFSRALPASRRTRFYFRPAYRPRSCAHLRHSPFKLGHGAVEEI